MLATTTTNQSSETRLSVSWLDYYRNNRESLLEIPWGRGAEISDLERAAIGGSIREFQLGESSEGKHILRCAREFAAPPAHPCLRRSHHALRS